MHEREKKKMELQSAIVTDIAEVSTVYSEKGRKLDVKNRRWYGISFCIDGQITYTQNGVEYVEDKAHAVILPQGQSYSLRGDATGNFPLVNFLTLEPLTNTITVIDLPNKEPLLRSYEELKRVFFSSHGRAKAMSLLYQMLYELSSRKSIPIIEPAIKFIHDNYCMSDLTNEMLANECNISEVYLRKLFATHFSTSPKQYILALRLGKAKQMLSEGAEKIWTVAEKCGFESNSHFCRTFKEQLGMTPNEYRKRYRIYEI